jgi:hypothetical protein
MRIVRSFRKLLVKPILPFPRDARLALAAVLMSTRTKNCWQQTYLLNMTVFWDVGPCSLTEVYQSFRSVYCLHRPDDGNCKHVWNANKLLLEYTTQHPRRLPSSLSLPWELDTLHHICSCLPVTTYLSMVLIVRNVQEYNQRRYWLTSI